MSIGAVATGATVIGVAGTGAGAGGIGAVGTGVISIGDAVIIIDEMKGAGISRPDYFDARNFSISLSN